jgi:hypothetical protein
VIYRASCVVCGEVVIRADESCLYLRADDSSLPPASPQAPAWRCAFCCPVCRRDMLWPVPPGASHLLVAGGARVNVAQGEPRPPPTDRTTQTDPQLHLDDVIDFHALLSGDAWFDDLARNRHSRRGQNG